MVSRSIVLGLFVLSGAALSDEPSVCRGGTTQPLVAPGAPVEGELATNRSRSHVLYVRAGDYVHVTIEPLAVPIVAALLDPGRAIAAEARDPEGGDAPLHLSTIAARSGVHEVKLVVPGKAQRSGRYRLTVDPPRAASDDDRIRVQAAKAYADGARLSSEQTADSTREAMKRYGEARDASHRIGDVREEADAWTAIGELQLGQGSAREARAATETALALYRTGGDRRGEATALNGLGVTTWSLGESRGALVYYERALPIAHELALPSVEASILSNMGSAYTNLGEARTAVAFYERSLPLRRQAGDLAGEATSLSNIGVAYRMLGDRGRALSAYEEAIPLARAADNTAAEGVALQNLGALSLGVGDLERGEEVLGAALDLSRRTGDRRGEGFILGWLSHAQRLRGDLAKAIALSNEDLTLQRAIGDRHGEGATLTYLGSLHRLRRETAAANETLSAALRVQREIGNRSGETYGLLELAGLRQDTGDLSAATRLFAQALAASRSIDDPGAEATALFHRAQLRRAQGDLPAARDEVTSAIALLEAARARVEGSRLRAAFFTSAQDAYELLIDLLMTMDTARPRQGFARQALDASERKRARSLIDLLTSAGVNSPASTPAAPSETLDAPRLLDDRTVVVEFSLGERASYAWAITRSGIHAARLAPRAEIAAAARAFHDVLATPPPRGAAEADRRTQRWEAAGAELTRLVLEPLADHLDRERIAIVADGTLHYTPFAALPAPRPKRVPGEPPIAARPLVADHEVVFLPSITALARLLERPPTHKATRMTVAALADPVFEADDPRVDRRGDAPDAAGPAAAQPRADLLRAARDTGLSLTGAAFPRLLYSREEAEAIAAAAAPGAVLRALDFDASRSTALSPGLSDYDIIHFATHGFVDDARPDLSGLVLSLVDRAGRAQDGFLRLRDLYGLRIPVELVVLSGCRTALGREVRGEGLLGIVRAFMHAGARRVVASVWDVDDRATAVFMKSFYEAMLGSYRSPAAALREAQLALRARERWRDPFYWAAFVIQGPWS